MLQINQQASEGLENHLKTNLFVYLYTAQSVTWFWCPLRRAAPHITRSLFKHTCGDVGYWVSFLWVVSWLFCVAAVTKIPSRNDWEQERAIGAQGSKGRRGPGEVDVTGMWAKWYSHAGWGVLNENAPPPQACVFKYLIPRGWHSLRRFRSCGLVLEEVHH